MSASSHRLLVRHPATSKGTGKGKSPDSEPRHVHRPSGDGERVFAGMFWNDYNVKML